MLWQVPWPVFLTHITLRVLVDKSTLTDQGPSKVHPTYTFAQGYNTNHTEDPEVNLCADNADAIQPHKGSNVFKTLKQMAERRVKELAAAIPTEDLSQSPQESKKSDNSDEGGDPEVDLPGTGENR